MAMTPDEAWASYLWPDSMTMKNKLGIYFPGPLQDAEYQFAAQRAAEITSGAVEIPQTFDGEHFKAIHGHLFQDVYEWAGQMRTVNMVKAASVPSPDGGLPERVRSPFLSHETLPEFGRALGDSINGITWDTLDRAGVMERLGIIYTEVNRAHPARDGNGRVTRLFMRDVAREAGYDFDESGVGRGELIDAAIASIRDDLDPITDLFDRHCTPLEQTDVVAPDDVDDRSLTLPAVESASLVGDSSVDSPGDVSPSSPSAPAPKPGPAKGVPSIVSTRDKLAALPAIDALRNEAAPALPPQKPMQFPDVQL